MRKRTLITAALDLERSLLEDGYQFIAGLDEAGRGAWAGPVSAAAVILPLDRGDLPDILEGVNDSKLLTPERRAELAPLIKEIAVSWGVGRATNAEIDRIGIVMATQTAMERALCKLVIPPEFLLIDALNLSDTVMAADRQMHIIKGDQRSLSIAAASILAKVTRDEYMVGLDDQFPEYGFADNKGYGTKKHRTGLARCGPCRAHRFSFKPVMNCRPLL